jgi:hypothetical protein
LPDEDTVIRQAGDKARQAWIKRKRAANLNNDDRGWVNGLRVGPLDERGRRSFLFTFCDEYQAAADALLVAHG